MPPGQANTWAQVVGKEWLTTTLPTLLSFEVLHEDLEVDRLSAE